MAKKSKSRKIDPVEFIKKSPSDAIVLSIDPGAESGWALLIGNSNGIIDRHSSGRVSVFETREVEIIIQTAIDLALMMHKPLYMFLEHWPSPFSGKAIHTYLGLGEARGIWRREFNLKCRENYDRNIRIGRTNVLAQNRDMLVNVGTWRGALIQETGCYKNGKPAKCNIPNNNWSIPVRPFSSRQYELRIDSLDTKQSYFIEIPPGIYTTQDIYKKFKSISGVNIKYSKKTGLSIISIGQGKESGFILDGLISHDLHIAGAYYGENGKFSRFDSKQWKSLAQQYAQKLYGENFGPDESEAIMIGQYGIRMI
jgi:hypothetical protein